MNMQYPILHTLEVVWAPYHIFRQCEGYYIALPKPRRNAILSLGYTVIPSLDYTVIPSLGHTTIPLSRYPKNTLGSITYILTHDGVLRSPKRKPIPSLRCSIIKHKVLLCFLKAIAHAQNYFIHLQYPMQGIFKIHWAP